MTSTAGISIKYAPEDALRNRYGSAIIKVEARGPVVLITSYLGSADCSSPWTWLRDKVPLPWFLSSLPKHPVGQAAGVALR